MTAIMLAELKERAGRVADATSEAAVRVREAATELWTRVEADVLGRPWFWALALMLLLFHDTIIQPFNKCDYCGVCYNFTDN